MAAKPLIGFVGQGFIGKNYADDFVARGYEVVRYSLDPAHQANKDKIKECDIVFIAVPTPTTPAGFDASILRQAIKLAGAKKTVVIKSTVTPGLTELFQSENPDLFILHSPEFLSEATAAIDAAQPKRNIIGLPVNNEEFKKRAEAVMAILPRAPYEKVCGAKEAEIIKYARNCLGYVRVVFANLLYDLTTNLQADWATVREAISADPDNGQTYLNPVHKSGRGAGGNCFIKDFAAFVELYKAKVDDPVGLAVLESNVKKNLELLTTTGKDLELVRGVYGHENFTSHSKN